MNSDIQNLIRTHYQGMSGYSSAGMESGKDESKVFMNANENHFVLPDLAGMNFYPEPQPADLLNAMADAYGVTNKNLVVTRGADEALDLLAEIFCEPHEDTVIIHKPTFGMYAVNANSMPAKVMDVPLVREEDKFTLDVDAIIDAVSDEMNKVKLIHLCSPNNPTGGAFPKEDLLKIIQAAQGRAMVVLDEAYAEFSHEGSLIEKLGDHPNLIILRTLSKAYALAGVRVGAMLSGDVDFISFVKTKVLDAYPLPRPSVQAALTALAPENREQIKKNIESALTEKKRLAEHFSKSPFVTMVFESDANFFLAEFENAKGFWQFCFDKGIVLRDFSAQPGTENCLRISPGLPEHNDRLMALLDEYTVAASAVSSNG